MVLFLLITLYQLYNLYNREIYPPNIFFAKKLPHRFPFPVVFPYLYTLEK